MEKVSKKELVANVAKTSGKTQVEVSTISEALIATIKEQVSNGNEVDIYNFVNFKVITQKAKTGKIPGTDKVYTTTEKSVVKAVLSKSFKNSVE